MVAVLRAEREAERGERDLQNTLRRLRRWHSTQKRLRDRIDARVGPSFTHEIFIRVAIEVEARGVAEGAGEIDLTGDSGGSLVGFVGSEGRPVLAGDATPPRPGTRVWPDSPEPQERASASSTPDAPLGLPLDQLPVCPPLHLPLHCTMPLRCGWHQSCVRVCAEAEGDRAPSGCLNWRVCQSSPGPQESPKGWPFPALFLAV